MTVRRCKMFRDCKYYLVIAPYSALNSWREALTAEGQEFLNIKGTRQQRLGALDMFGSSLFPKRLWGLTNKECHRSIGVELAAFAWDVVILDESTFIKDLCAVSRYCIKNFRDVKHRFVLTGTPAPEHELNYFNQLRFLDERILVVDNYFTFRNKWFLKPLGAGGEHQYFLSRAGSKFLTQRLAKFCCFVTRDEIGFKVEPVYQVRKYELPEAARKAYRHAEQTFILKYLGEEVDRTVYSIEVFTWLRRMCGGSMADADGNVSLIHDVKAQGLGELLSSELFGQQVVIWAVYHAETELIIARLRAQGISYGYVGGMGAPVKRQQTEKDFQAGKLQVLICQPECYRHGVNLSCADTMIYYSSPVGLETRQQTERRTMLMKKTKRPLIIDLCIEDSIDEDILLSLNKKEKKSEQIKTIVKGILSRKHLDS